MSSAPPLVLDTIVFPLLSNPFSAVPSISSVLTSAKDIGSAVRIQTSRRRKISLTSLAVSTPANASKAGKT